MPFWRSKDSTVQNSQVIRCFKGWLIGKLFSKDLVFLRHLYNTKTLREAQKRTVRNTNITQRILLHYTWFGMLPKVTYCLNCQQSINPVVQTNLLFDYRTFQTYSTSFYRRLTGGFCEVANCTPTLVSLFPISLDVQRRPLIVAISTKRPWLHDRWLIFSLWSFSPCSILR